VDPPLALWAERPADNIEICVCVTGAVYAVAKQRFFHERTTVVKIL